MLKSFISTVDDLRPTAEISQASWVMVSEPQDGEIALLRQLGIPSSLLDHVRDLNERPRAEQDGAVLLIVMHFPCRQSPDASIPFLSMPVSIFLTQGRVVTVTPHATDLLERILEGDVRQLATETPARFVLRLMLQLADEYLKALDEINAEIEKLENALQQSQRNEEVLGLLRYEKSLVYFTTSLTSNELLLQRLQKGVFLEWSEADRRLLDDVMIEVHQAMEMVNIVQNLLSQMMDAFASIVSNNLNSVMKFLTSATIIISIPTMIASFYGMNVLLPGAHSPLAFTWIAAASVLVTLTMIAIFIRKHWF